MKIFLSALVTSALLAAALVPVVPVGAMAWQRDGLTLQVSGVDNSQQTAFGAGLLTLATDLATWKTVSAHADASGAGLSRGQADPQGFGYTLAATVEGASHTAQVVDGRKVGLTITPSRSCTIWFTASSRFTAPDRDSARQARNALASVKAAGHQATLMAHRAWWDGFWSRSFVQCSGLGGDADHLENVYYLATYMIAAGGYGDHPFLASNHVDLLSAFTCSYSRNHDALKAFTRSRFGVDGAWVPETMGWDGNARGTVNSDYTKNIYSTGPEVALTLYLRYRYTDDTAYLRDTAYPFMRETARFIQSRFSCDSATGEYRVASSNSHETYWNVPNAITDLAAVRSLFPVLIRTSRQLGLDADLRPGWQRLLDGLVAYPTDGSAYLPHSPPIAQARDNENVAAELIWPYDRTGIGYPDQQAAITTWNRRPFPCGNVWAPDAIQAARLGLGDQAYQGMKQMLRQYQNHPNGMTSNTNGMFEYLGVHLSVVNESLMQSYNDKIGVFPAVPGDPSFDNAVLLTTTAGEFDLPTTAGAAYVVERTAKPLTSCTRTRLTGHVNQDAKSLGGTASTLGLPRTADPVVNDTELTYDGGRHHTTDRGYGDHHDDTHRSTTDGAVAQYAFTGTGVRYCSERNGDMGPVDVHLDGAFQATVDLRADGPRRSQQVVWERSGLGRGQHTLRIVNRSTSVGMVDALYIIP